RAGVGDLAEGPAAPWQRTREPGCRRLRPRRLQRVFRRLRLFAAVAFGDLLARVTEAELLQARVHAQRLAQLGLVHAAQAGPRVALHVEEVGVDQVHDQA